MNIGLVAVGIRFCHSCTPSHNACLCDACSRPVFLLILIILIILIINIINIFIIINIIIAQYSY